MQSHLGAERQAVSAFGLETPPRCAYGSLHGGARAGRWLEATRRTRKSNSTASGQFLRKPSQPVPKVTPSVGINLNERLLLRRSHNAITVAAPDIAPSGPTVAKPSVDHIPAGGFRFEGGVARNDDKFKSAKKVKPDEEGASISAYAQGALSRTQAATEASRDARAKRRLKQGEGPLS
jgi:hypothetical protein